ncbi:hypothetical protein VTK56DRAFT_3964 [Thermocarpiscus australiensis]
MSGKHSLGLSTTVCDVSHRKAKNSRTCPHNPVFDDIPERPTDPPNVSSDTEKRNNRAFSSRLRCRQLINFSHHSTVCSRSRQGRLCVQQSRMDLCTSRFDLIGRPSMRPVQCSQACAQSAPVEAKTARSRTKPNGLFVLETRLWWLRRANVRADRAPRSRTHGVVWCCIASSRSGS